MQNCALPGAVAAEVGGLAVQAGFGTSKPRLGFTDPGRLNLLKTRRRLVEGLGFRGLGFRV